MLFSEMYATMKPGDMIVGSNYAEPHVELWFIVSVERGRDIYTGELYVHFHTYQARGTFTDRTLKNNTSSFHSYWQESVLVYAGQTK